MHNWQFSDKCISYLKEFMILELFVNFMILKEAFLTSNGSLTHTDTHAHTHHTHTQAIVTHLILYSFHEANELLCDQINLNFYESANR